jgi:molecular chaperone GrpE (heat shock protein)
MKFFIFVPVLLFFLFIAGCSDNSGEEGFVAKLINKIPGLKKEEPEKTELELLKEQYDALVEEYKEKKSEHDSIKKELVGEKNKNRRGGVSTYYKCGGCGEILSVRKGSKPNKCIYCGNRNSFSRVENRASDALSSQEKLRKNRRVMSLQKEMDELKIKITNIKDQAKAIKAKDK